VAIIQHFREFSSIKIPDNSRKVIAYWTESSELGIFCHGNSQQFAYGTGLTWNDDRKLMDRAEKVGNTRP